MIKNSKRKLNKRAVAMFSLCLILFVMIMPFAVYADSITFSFTYPNSSYKWMYIKNQSNQTITSIQSTGSYSYTRTADFDYDYTYHIYSYEYNNIYASNDYFKIYIRENGVDTLLSTDSTNPTIITSFNFIMKQSGSGSKNYYFSIQSVGYTLVFDSQGGSSISSESGVTDIVLGVDDEYYPQYVPTRPGYIFHGWSRYENGPILYSTTLTEDTILYAQWYESDSEVAVTFSSGSYYDRNMGNAISGTIAVDNSEDFTFYYKYTGTSYFTGKLNLIDSHNRIYDVISAAELYDPDPNDYINPYKYKYSYKFTKTTTIQPVVSSLYEVNGYIHILPYSYIYEDIVGFVQNAFFTINYPGGQSFVFPFTRDTENELIYFSRSGIPPGSTIDITSKIIPPLKPQRGYISYPDRDEGEFDDITIYESFVDDINNQYGYYENVKLSFSVDEDTDFNLLIVPIQNTELYHIPVIVKDNSTGEYMYTFSETEFYDTDWSEVGTIFPSNLGKILDGLYGLQGLAIIVPLVMMVSFAMWFIRRS